jgi:hypothetical protein
MSYHILFWMLCAVLAAHVVVAIIAVTKAYRDERRSFFFKPGRRTKRAAVVLARSTRAAL